MTNQIYPNTSPFAHERNTNVNFNYVWDSQASNWIPQQGISGANLSKDHILQNAKQSIHKFGSNPNVVNTVSVSNPETVWDGSTEYIFPPDAGTGIQVQSDDAGDNQEIIIEGLDENFYEKTWTGNLNGSTNVNIDGTWTRVYRAYNNGSTDFAGDIDIHASGGATSYAQILGANNQTLMAVYTVPANCMGYVVKYNLSAQNTSSASEIGFTAQLRTREYGKVFRVKEITSVNTTSSIEQEMPFPLKLEPKTDILFNIVNANGNNGSVNADFDLALI